MNFDTLTEHIAETFPRLSPQLQRAARHVLDNPDDVALISLRQLAARAGVHPATLVRLIRAFGFGGYDEFREPFRQRLRVSAGGYLERARDLQARGAGGEAVALLDEIRSSAVGNLEETFAVNGTDRLLACAGLLAAARRIYVVGLRSCFPVAFYFHYACRMFRDQVMLLEGRGGTFVDDLRDFAPDDVMFAVSFEPYALETVRATQYAFDHGGKVVAVTDSLLSPVAENTGNVLLVKSEGPAVFHYISTTVALAEALVVLMVAEGGAEALRSIEAGERRLADFDTYWHGASQPRRPDTGKEQDR